MNDTAEFLKFLQSCMAPLVIISGIGLLLLSVTNRFGRAIDRTRQLKTALDRGPGPDETAAIRRQMAILFRRCRILQWSVGCICAAVVGATLLVALLAAMQLSGLALVPFALGLFIVALLSVVAASGLFLWDIVLALAALEIEVGKR
jgi:hypothetical protein